MRKPRLIETAEQRHLRFKEEALQKADRIKADDAEVAKMIRQNIELYGP